MMDRLRIVAICFHYHYSRLPSLLISNLMICVHYEEIQTLKIKDREYSTKAVLEQFEANRDSPCWYKFPNAHSCPCHKLLFFF